MPKAREYRAGQEMDSQSGLVVAGWIVVVEPEEGDSKDDLMKAAAKLQARYDRQNDRSRRRRKSPGIDADETIR